MTPPPILDDFQRKRDLEHLNLLAIFHFVLSGLAFLGIGFLAFHYTLMNVVFSNPDLWKSPKTPPPFNPAEFWRVFVWLYVVVGVVLMLVSVLNALSGLFIRQRRRRTFSMVVAGLDCLQIQFGTALGALTLIVLSRDSVREFYHST